MTRRSATLRCDAVANATVSVEPSTNRPLVQLELEVDRDGRSSWPT